MPAGKNGRGAWAGDALGVRRRLLDWIEERWSDLIIRSGIHGTPPDRDNTRQSGALVSDRM